MNRSVVSDGEIKNLDMPSRSTGVEGYYITADGVSKGFTPGDWLERTLLPPDASTPDFISRPVAHQFLQP